ncbi:MAG: hypothetical protein M3Y27_32255 [Acidobacteriota bacterium]|nr:hypothetical protein [Acidobacteriota bacterium]
MRGLDSRDRRRPYCLTAEGRRYLQEELGSLDRMVKTGLRRLKHA